MKKFLLFISFLSAFMLLQGCNYIDNALLGVEEDFKGLSGTVQSYDEESQIIDQVYGKSVSFKANDEFIKYSESGSSGSVLEVTVGGKQMIHVGSTLLFYQDGLTNVFDEYSKKYNVEDHNRSIPILNEMVNSFENSFIGTDKIILIRSQSGKPLATFAGDNVSISAMEVDKMSKITIDGKRIYIYRADFTIYDSELLLNKK